MAQTDFLAFDDVRRKLLSLSKEFKDAVIRVVNSDNEDFNSDLDDFEANLTSIIIDGTIGEALQTLFNSFDIVGDTSRDQYVLSTQLFDFGDDDTLINASPKQSLNKTSINTGVQVNSLALALSNAVAIDFSNQEDLIVVLEQLDAQYQKAIDKNLDSETRISLLDLKTTAFRFFAQLDLKAVINIETTTIPSTVLSYQYYKDSSRADEIIELNDIQNTGFIEGDVKIISI